MAVCLTVHKTMPADFDDEIGQVLRTKATLSIDENGRKYIWNALQQHKTTTIRYLFTVFYCSNSITMVDTILLEKLLCFINMTLAPKLFCSKNYEITVP